MNDIYKRHYRIQGISVRPSKDTKRGSAQKSRKHLVITESRSWSIRICDNFGNEIGKILFPIIKQNDSSNLILHRRTEMKESAKIDLEISKEQIQSLARVLLPCLQEYLSSEQGQKDFAEWTQKEKTDRT